MPSRRLFSFLVDDDDADVQSLSKEARPHIARNGLRQMAAQALQSTGDQVVNAKTVLPWLVTALGAPGAFVAFLVPIRESGSMLPQAAWAPKIRQSARRKGVWVLGAAGQAVATAGLALVAAAASGAVAGVGVLACLALFALSRSLTSIASKDVLGRTIPQGLRGQIKGVTTVASAAVALTLGLSLRVWGGADLNTLVLAALLGGAALAWAAAAAVYATIKEPAEEPETPDDGPGWVAQARDLVRDDTVFRRFVTARALLMVTALSPPFIVTLGALAGAGEEGGASLAGLGPFVIAQSLAGLIGGRFFGGLADRSSRRLMIGASLAGSAVILAFLGLALVPVLAESPWLAVGAYLLLALTHVGARLARKTYVVDIAEGDQRTQYVAVANTLMGVLLLALGAVTAGLAAFGGELALLLLAALGIAGAWVGRTLPEAGRD